MSIASSSSWTVPSSPSRPCSAMKATSGAASLEHRHEVAPTSIATTSWRSRSSASCTCAPERSETCRSSERPPLSTATREAHLRLLRRDRRAPCDAAAARPRRRGLALGRARASGPSLARASRLRRALPRALRAVSRAAREGAEEARVAAHDLADPAHALADVLLAGAGEVQPHRARATRVRPCRRHGRGRTRPSRCARAGRWCRCSRAGSSR